jgi:hypothetical protein
MANILDSENTEISIITENAIEHRQQKTLGIKYVRSHNDISRRKDSEE